MQNNDQFDNQHQFVVSYELLALILWIINNEDASLKRLVKKAFASGLKKELVQIPPSNDTELLEEAQQGIIDFFGILETHLLDAMHEQSVQQAMEKDLLPTIDHIDTAHCDDIVLRKSIETATNEQKNYSKEQAQKVLFKELLRNWKPHKKQIMN